MQVDIVKEADLGKIQFTPRDGVFLFTGNQVAFLHQHAHPSVAQAKFFSLSLHAYAEILKAGHRDTETHDRFASDEEVRQVRLAATPHDRVWLVEMGCRMEVLGVDFAEIDSLCQYYFFRYAGYLALVLRRMIERNPNIERFFVIRGPEPLPMDFDFDGDIGYGVAKYLCAEAGCPVVEIVSSRHLPAHGENFLQRPYSTGWATPFHTRPEDPAIHAFRVGFLPSTVPSGLRIIRDAQSLNCAMTLFYSPWAISAPRPLTDEQEAAQATGEDRAWWAAMDNQLTGLRAVMQQRLERSTLPPVIVRNPHLAFQFDHILLRRWPVLARILRGAARHVAAHPLDLFINPEIATWEGMILATLYRQAGTRILVAPHSGWPGQRFDSSIQPSDRTMVYSRLGGETLRQRLAPAKIYHTGMPWVSSARSPDGESKTAAVRDKLAGRKLVVFVTNPTEISFIPSHDQPAHFAMMAKLAKVPKHLQDKVVLALRRRASKGGEDDVIYRTLGGVSDEQLHLLNGISFQECIELADCMVGITQQTSGYYDIFENRKPVLHLQGIGTIYQQPDLPPDLLGNLTDPDALWPAIERVLFDDAHREALVERQHAFVRADVQPDFPMTQSPIRTLLHLLLTEDQ